MRKGGPGGVAREEGWRCWEGGLVDVGVRGGGVEGC